MALRSAYGYRAEITVGPEDRPVRVVDLVEPDWEPALQWSYFQQVRSGAGRPLMRCADGGVEPVWDAELGHPFVSGFRVVPGVGRGAVGPAAEIPGRYLRPDVESAASRLVSEGALTAGEPYRFRLLAGPPPPQRRPARPAGGIRIEPVVRPLAVATGSFRRLAAGAVQRDADAADPVDLRVVVRPTVLADAVALAAATPEVETGGVLVGALCRDVEDGDLFLDVRALIPAKHAVATADRLTFTADTWADAQAAITLRGGDECWVGWAHSHPFFCRACPAEARRTCALTIPFLSEHDRSLHRAIFARPFDVALLVSDAGPAGHTCALFGWRHGMIERRGYHEGESDAGATG